MNKLSNSTKAICGAGFITGVVGAMNIFSFPQFMIFAISFGLVLGVILRLLAQQSGAK